MDLEIQSGPVRDAVFRVLVATGPARDALYTATASGDVDPDLRRRSYKILRQLEQEDFATTVDVDELHRAMESLRVIEIAGTTTEILTDEYDMTGYYERQVFNRQAADAMAARKELSTLAAALADLRIRLRAEAILNRLKA